MKKYRITKYNPENRNAEGHYLIDEWTCPSEVGKVFNGLKFEEAEYFEIESKYVDAAVKLIRSKSINSLRIVGLITNYMAGYFSDQDNQWLLERKFKKIELFEDKSVDISEIEIIIKMNLRNFMSCYLEIDGKFCLNFGYDYYMYVSMPNCNSGVLDEINKTGLYVEEIPLNAIKYQFYVQSGRKNQEVVCVEEEILLNNMTRDKIRVGLGLSIEHPCNHGFKITSKNCSIFSEQIEFDFDKNDYFLSCDMDFS